MFKKWNEFFILSFIIGAFFIFIGCNDSSITDLNTPQVNGEVNILMDVVTHAPIGYAPKKNVTPTTLISDPIADKDLTGCAIIISRITLIDDTNEEHIVFNARYREDGAIILIDNGANNLICNLVNTNAPKRVVGANSYLLNVENINWFSEIPAGNYRKLKINVEEVCVTYLTSSGNTVNWHDNNYNKTFVLEAGMHFSPFSISKGETKKLIIKFNLSGRIGKTEGEFEPDVYMIIKE